ncbi:MBOAT-domain-containing protein [Myriangium duriaei CBS 260.36]|uniref:O-acyltransferase n=1 Tax=Myriangium duriaei CBS 260.36 TaxID=1168546 RepID=A0A9P4J7X6_9PEZI|nr:MBOAT-domain-containing protein [Myriangium duriaei CBS 260.36]
MNGDHNGIRGLRERKSTNPVARAIQEDATLRASLPNGIASSGLSSGTSTPLPADALPSVIATSSARKERRAEQKKRLFPTVNYTSRVSHFDPKSEHADFRGFFVLFWIGLAIMVITTMLRNMKDFGQLLSLRQWETLSANIWEMGASDMVMSASTGLVLPLHLLFKNGRGVLQWDVGGMWIQSAFQLAWLSFWTTWPFIRNWTWTAQVFFTLHLLSLFMKMHSYAFYNGHLAVTLRRLNELDNPSPLTDKQAAVKYPSSHAKIDEIGDEQMRHEEDKDQSRRSSVGQLREELAYELVSPLGRVTYPQNLTVANYVDFLCVPTLCYEIEYPRTQSRSYMEIFYKTLAVFGCIFLLTVVSDEYIIPALDESAVRLRQQHSWSEGALIFAETVSGLLFPFMVTFLLVFLVIFEYLCGAFAEITRFADRQFYSAWWNCLDFLQFSREWNIPVHQFLNRHVYSVSRTTLSRPVATIITFLISALAHELVMGCITRKFRGYGFVAMMLQIPIIAMQRAPWVRKRKLLNNVLFWCSMILGLSLICALYVLV